MVTVLTDEFSVSISGLDQTIFRTEKDVGRIQASHYSQNLVHTTVARRTQ